MLYVIHTEYFANSIKKRLLAHTDHLMRLRILLDQGKLITAGQLPAVDSDNPGKAGFTGSVVIAEFESLEVATIWARSDSYFTTGVYAYVSVKPYKKVF